MATITDYVTYYLGTSATASYTTLIEDAVRAIFEEYDAGITVEAVTRVSGQTITMFLNEIDDVSVTVEDTDLDALTLEFTVEDAERNDVVVIANGDITRSNQTFTVEIDTDVTDTIGQYYWSLRDITGGINEVVSHGVLVVAYAAANDA
jgi:hypothetical protein